MTRDWLAVLEIDPVMNHLDTDKNLLFGVIAMQSALIDMRQFVDACTLWSSRKDSTMADVLVEQGWLQEEVRSHVDYLLARRVKKLGGDVRKLLAAMHVAVKSALKSINNPSIHACLAGLPAEVGENVIPRTKGEEREHRPLPELVG